uniref:LRR containing protein n=1 Tax=Panagrellus redivivus TaxID=6233 RepID=A0A7E4V0I6_PANRE
MNTYPQLTKEEITDFEGILDLINNFRDEEEQKKFIEKIPCLEGIVYDHGHIYADTFKIVKHHRYASRKRPTESHPTLKLLDLLDELRTTVTDRIIMDKCNVGTVDSLLSVNLQFENLTKLDINNTYLTPAEMYQLTDMIHLKNVKFSNCVINREVDISKHWSQLYNCEDLHLDIRNLKYGQYTNEWFRSYRRTEPCNTMVLHNLPNNFPVDAFFDYILTSPTCPKHLELIYNNETIIKLEYRFNPCIKKLTSTFKNQFDVKFTFYSVCIVKKN